MRKTGYGHKRQAGSVEVWSETPFPHKTEGLETVAEDETQDMVSIAIS
jgi:hypothetical protein